MQSVVVIPTLHRPEFLALSLEKIAFARNVPKEIHIYLDTCQEERRAEVMHVRDEYYPTADIFYAPEHVKAISGSWNILHALKDGYESGANFIFMIEEDVMVRPEFFDRHISMQLENDYFVTCGRRAVNRDEGFYSNPGTCYRREKLALIMPHINESYFADPRVYVDNLFPGMDKAGMLDDGLIQRIIWTSNGRVGYAAPGIAVHQGFHNYNKYPQFKVEGTIQERIFKLRILLSKMTPFDRYSKDFEEF